METFSVQTSERLCFVSMTDEVARRVRASGLEEGAVLVFIPHTTAGVTLNENADPDVRRDLALAFRRISPELPEFRHAEGNSDSHVLASMVGPSLLVPISGGRLVLGQWQDIYFCEFDGPRRRQVHVQFLPGVKASAAAV